MKTREQRLAVNFAARMRCDGEWFNVSVRDMSAHGLLVKPGAELRHRSYVELQRGNQIVIGQVVWSQDGKTGLRSQDRIDLNDMMCASKQKGNARPAVATTFGTRTPSIDEARRNAAERAERGRAFARNFQFIAIGAAGMAGCAVIFMAVTNVLGKAFATTMAALGG